MTTTIKATDTDVLGVSARQVNENTFIIPLVNGKEIKVIKDAEYKSKDLNGNDRVTVWNWKVDTQYFGTFAHARDYLNILIAEKLTGNRIVYHVRREVPNICGCEEFLKAHADDTWGCHAQTRGEFSALCSDCPIAEEIQAKRDGVNLVYAIAE